MDRIAEVRQSLRLWQERLGLQDWRVNARWLRQSDGVGPAVQADIDWFTHRPQAELRVRKPCTEHTLVHELLHLRLEGHRDRPVAYNVAYERALNVLTDVLVGVPEEW